jgi:hypothetical protein
VGCELTASDVTAKVGVRGTCVVGNHSANQVRQLIVNPTTASVVVHDVSLRLAVTELQLLVRNLRTNALLKSAQDERRQNLTEDYVTVGDEKVLGL